MNRTPNPNCANCAWILRFTGIGRQCGKCQQEAARAAKEAKAMQERQWYRETGHCGHCGDPGVFCTCTERDPCGCRELHEMGSAKLPDALAAFTDEAPVAVSDDQLDMFGGAR